MEIVKHLFDIPNITFIIATDSKQLSHSINAVYGNNFASERYLKRFFDQEYTLKTPNNYDYAYYMFEKYGLLDEEKLFTGLDQDLYKEENLNVVLFSKFAEFFKLVPRDINQSIIMLSTITLTWDKEQPLHLGYLVFLIMLKQKSNEAFEKYIEVYDFDEFCRAGMEESIIQFIKSSLQLDVTIKVFKNRMDNYGYVRGKERKAYRLQEIINNYSNINNMTRKRLHQVSGSDISIIDNLFTKIEHSEDISHHHNDIISITLQQYPKMILQAGQFTQK